MENHSIIINAAAIATVEITRRTFDAARHEGSSAASSSLSIECIVTLFDGRKFFKVFTDEYYCMSFMRNIECAMNGNLVANLNAENPAYITDYTVCPSAKSNVDYNKHGKKNDRGADQPGSYSERDS